MSEQAEIKKEKCKKCGRELQTFHHNCPNSSSYEEKFGCPSCDDVCPFCTDESVKARKIFVVAEFFDRVLEGVSVFSKFEEAKKRWESWVQDWVENATWEEYCKSGSDMQDEVNGSKVDGSDILETFIDEKKVLDEEED